MNASLAMFKRSINRSIHRQTFSFVVRRFTNLAISYVFPDGRQSCMLCHRPMRILASRSADVTFGRVCLFCEQELSSVAIHARVRRLRLRVHPRVSHVSVVAAVPHEGIIRRAIRQWKYDGCLEATTWLATILARGYLMTWSHTDADAVVPVPTSFSRLRQRGYDHVRMLAENVAGQLNLPILCSLQRDAPVTDPVPGYSGQEATRSQTGLTKSGRAMSVARAYSANGSSDIAGRRFLLVDDIVTSGATMQACAVALFRAGAEQVRCAAIAWEE